MRNNKIMLHDKYTSVAQKLNFFITNKNVFTYSKSNSPEARFFRNINIKEVWKQRSFIDNDI